MHLLAKRVYNEISCVVYLIFRYKMPLHDGIVLRNRTSLVNNRFGYLCKFTHKHIPMWMKYHCIECTTQSIVIFRVDLDVWTWSWCCLLWWSNWLNYQRRISQTKSRRFCSRCKISAGSHHTGGNRDFRRYIRRRNDLIGIKQLIRYHAIDE